jgi:hypothetical protein
MSDRTFTLDEAQVLVPVLESLLRTAIAGKKLMEEVEAEMQALAHRIFLNGGTHVDVVPLARRKAERAKAEQRAKDAIAEIDSIGVQDAPSCSAGRWANNPSRTGTRLKKDLPAAK